MTRDDFAPHRVRRFMIKSVGMRPDLMALTTFVDLRDGGTAWAARIVERLLERSLLH